MRTVLTFEQFVFENSGDHFQRNSLVHEILLKNRDRIKDEANVDDYLFNKVLDELSENPPLSIEEEDIVADAITMAYMWRDEAIPYMKLDQGDRMADELLANRDGKTGVAVQNYDNSGAGDSQAF